MIKELEQECNEYFEKTMLSGMTDFTVNGDPEQIEEESPVPPAELQMFWMTRSYHALPWKGGLLDQPDFLMMCMNVCESAERSAEEVRRRILESRRRAETNES